MKQELKKVKELEQNAIQTNANNGQEKQAEMKEETEIEMRAIMDLQNVSNNTTKKMMHIMERRNKEW